MSLPRTIKMALLTGALALSGLTGLGVQAAHADAVSYTHLRAHET